MKLTSPSQVRALLRDLDLRPSAALGQNFLVDANILGLILDAARVGPEDTVLEIGPGLGVLTEGLVARAGRVLGIEKDRRLYAYLKERFAAVPAATFRCGDFLDVDPAHLAADGVTKVVANLPYATGSRMLMDLARAPQPVPLMVVTVQLEVAERLAAAPGSRDRGLLSVWIQAAYGVEIVKVISPTCFFPVPRVRSALVRLEHRPRAALAPEARSCFYALTKEAFQYRRKQLATILSRARPPLGVAAPEAARILRACGLDPKVRPEELSLDDWGALAVRLIDMEAAT